MVFRYAIATGRAERDPSVDLRGALTAPRVNHRATIIDPKSIGALLRAIDGFDGQPTTLAALRLAAYVFVRPGELRLAEWNEFDLATAVWTISCELSRAANFVGTFRGKFCRPNFLHPLLFAFSRENARPSHRRPLA